MLVLAPVLAKAAPRKIISLGLELIAWGWQFKMNVSVRHHVRGIIAKTEC